jgi:outer membrane protein OmpA-like peptidoglycan-associated protein
MKLRLALAAATCLALPFVAHAQPVTGPYVSLEGGTSILNPVNFQDEAFGVTGKALFKNSYAGAGAIGFGFGNGFRVELSGNYYRNYASKIDTTSFGQFPLYGGHNTYGPMLNVLYDIPVGLPIFPYVGAGAGYQYVALNSYLKAGPAAISGTKGSFAYDLIGGVAYPLAMVPGLSLTLEYRFTQLTESTKYGESLLGGIPPGADAGSTNKVGQESSHTFMFGVRYQLFNPPPPAPPVAAPPPVATPAPPPARTYLVFFDWDKSSLTPRADEIIAEAASDSKTSQVTTIDVSGYTDTSGTPVYNQGLSERRAKAVAAQLVTDGVPMSEIETHAYGETHLLVPTGPGVREPQNRRVEIVLQ